MQLLEDLKTIVLRRPSYFLLATYNFMDNSGQHVPRNFVGP